SRQLLMPAWLPSELSPTLAVGLIILSFFTSAFTAAVGVGGGVALITVLLLVLPPLVVLPLHGIVQAGSNLGRAYVMRDSVHWRITRWFAMGSIIGVVLAGLVFVNLPPKVLLIALSLFILWSLWAPRFKASSLPVPGYAGVGLVATFLTMFLGATGPLVAAFWDPARLGRHGVVATHGAAMSVQHLLKVAAFGYLGFAFGQWLPLIGAMIVTGYLGTLVGKRVLGWLPEAQFARIFKWTLTLLALRLLWSGLTRS
ncbi:MAG: sulfite exporter TauE/SafE family protein, partial [Burkholderiaceae bacterium]